MKHKTEWVSDVLIVDNDEERLGSLEKAFQSLSIPAIHTSNDYLQVDPKNKHSLIVVGDSFPQATVNEIIDHLSSKGLPKTIPLVLSTQSTDPSYIRSMMSAGIASIIGNTSNLDHIRKALDFCRRSEPSSKLKTLLDRLTFFSELNDEEKEQLLSVTVLRKFQAGEEIFAKGDPADVFYVLIKGKVMAILRRDDHHMNEIQISVGTPFGEMAILDKSPRSAWCIAADDSLVLEIGSHIFEDSNFLIRHKLFARLAIILAQRIRNMNKSLVKNQESEKSKTPEPKSKAPPPKAKKAEKPKSPPPEKPAPKKGEKKTPKAEEKKEGQEEEEEEESAEGKVNPFLSPTGEAENYSKTTDSQEKYDILIKKILLRTDFIAKKIPQAIIDLIRNRMAGYWTGGKLAKINPHYQWDQKKLYTPGTTNLKRALHLIAVNSYGINAMKEAYLDLELTQKVIGMEDIGCAGTYLSTDQAIDRFVKGECLKNAIQLDMDIPIDREWYRQEVIEFLTHTDKDVRDETLFLVFDRKDGKNTKKIRERFPLNQIVTVVHGTSFNPAEPSSIFTKPEEELEAQGVLLPKDQYDGTGFYQGQTVFLADLSSFYADSGGLSRYGYTFGTIAAFAQVGPNYSGVVWGSKGGAEGAVKAARAMFGVSGSSNPADLAAAVSWADG